MPTLIIEPDAERRAAAASLWSANEAANLAAAPFEDFDAAIVAVPQSHHHHICIALLAAGKHVLVEKPLATTAAEANELVAAARESSGSLSVAQMRRQLHVNRWLHRVVGSEQLGSLRSASVEEGSPDTWDAATSVHLLRESAGGGVLIGIGVHSLDLLTWWFGDLVVERYLDDNLGGVEANAQVELRTTTGATVLVELSQTRTLRNVATFQFDAGDVEVSLHSNELHRAPRLRRALRFHADPQAFGDLFVSQLHEWLADIADGGKRLPKAVDGARTQALIADCYQQRQLLCYPWQNEIPTGGLT